MGVTILTGPLGTELHRRGIPTPLPGWSAHALVEAPDAVKAIHADYAKAGATLHVTNTFRTKSRTFPDDWEELARTAVRLCREAVPAGHRVAGCISPLEDCYRPDLSPDDPRYEHRELAVVLADAGCDILLCETFPNVKECLIAVEEAVATGRETWASFTAGPNADLLTPTQVGDAARSAVDVGASAVLVNCIPVLRMREFVEQLVGLGVPFGAYANAGSVDDGFGWKSEPGEPERYAAVANEWIKMGATIVGSCCGTGPEHIAALAGNRR